MTREGILDLHPDVLKHGIADAARVVSHTQGGQVIPADMRMKSIPPDVARAIIEALGPNTETVQ